jgi:hypothetical protein
MATGDTTWRDALLVDAPRIAGLKVRPLSAWHCHVVQMLDVRVGFDEEGRGPTPGDVAAALVIFRSEYRPGVAGVPVPGWLMRKIYLPVRWLFRSWRKDALDLVRHVEAYRRYPEVIRKSDRETSPMGCPPYLAVAVDVAMQIPSMTLPELLNMSLLSLYCLRAAAVEMGGGPLCAWRTAASGDEIQAGLEHARQAIAKWNAQKEAHHGATAS